MSVSSSGATLSSSGNTKIWMKMSVDVATEKMFYFSLFCHNNELNDNLKTVWQCVGVSGRELSADDDDVSSSYR